MYQQFPVKYSSADGYGCPHLLCSVVVATILIVYVSGVLGNFVDCNLYRWTLFFSLTPTFLPKSLQVSEIFLIFAPSKHINIVKL